MMSAFNLKSALKNGVAYLEDVYGGAAIIMALMTPVIIGGLAFGAEVGGWELTKRQQQNAADTAAFAAATRWEATVKGRQAHGSTPHLGVDPIVTASGIVMALQTIRSRILSPLSENVVTVGVFRSGERHNIIPETAQLGGTIRTFDDETLATIEARMRDIFEGHTKAAHATFELAFDTGHPMTVNQAELTAGMVPTLERILGKDRVREAPPITGAEDFSYFAQVVPGFYFRLGVVPDGKVSGGHHTPTFYAADESVPIAMRLMTSLVVDFLNAGTG